VSHADISPLVLWHNRQTEEHLVLKPKLRNRCGDFDAQITKLKLSVLRPKSENPPPPWFWGSTKKLIAGFEAKPRETIATSFEAKLEKTATTGFEAKPLETIAAGFDIKPLETVATGFEAKPVKTVRVVLRPNHSQTVDLNFEAQLRNSRSSSPRARCKPHTAPPDFSTARTPNTWPVRPSPVLCTRSPTPAMVLIAARHAALATCTSWDKQTWFSKWNKGKRKTKQTILDLNSNLVISMTHHNQTNELTTWFLNLPFDESINNKSTKFDVRIQDPMKHS
jgi:hypothetical protein